MAIKHFGGQSMVDPLQTVLVRRPDAAFGAADPARWHYASQPDLARAQAEHDAFVGLLRQSGIKPIYHETPLPDHADAIFVHDPMLTTRHGAVLLQMAKPLRQGEVDAMAETLAALDIPIHYRLHGDATAEGGDLLWIDRQTLAVGLGFRTNAAALAQLQEALPDVEVIPVPLPYYQGPEACLHLMSFISLVDYDLAVVYRPLMPVPFFQLLEARGFRFVDVPEAEFATMGPNVLALAPGRCLMLAGNPVTQARLEAAGCEVLTYVGSEISLKAEGGATCLTRPLLRTEIPYPIVNPHLAGDAFLWPGGANGVLLIHGLTATTAEVRLLAHDLHAAGYTVAGPLLPGHGTRPEHLNQVTWHDWVWEVEQLYQHLATICDRVIVGGESTGAVLALQLASQHPEIAGILAYAPAIQLPLPVSDVIKLYASAPFLEFVPKSRAGANKYWQGYPVNPLRGVIELIRLGREVRQRLPLVTQPLLVVQGRHDTTIHPDSADIVLAGAASDVKQLHWMENSGHVVLLENERDAISALTQTFLRQILTT